MVQMIAGHMMLRHFQFVMIFQALAFLLLHCNLCNVQKESVSMQRRRCRRMTLSSTTTTSIFKKLYDEQEEIVCINGKRKHFYFLLQIVFNAIISHHHISRLFESKSRLYYIHARNEQRRAGKRERKTETKSFLPLSFVTLNVICAIIVRTYIFLSSRMEYSWHLFFFVFFSCWFFGGQHIHFSFLNSYREMVLEKISASFSWAWVNAADNSSSRNNNNNNTTNSAPMMKKESQETEFKYESFTVPKMRVHIYILYTIHVCWYCINVHNLLCVMLVLLCGVCLHENAFSE